MNIQNAKNYIKDTVSAYLKKDEFGDYRISVEKQRPIFLVGAPGIGKTAIMSQIAEEMGIALVSYSMTHHTRQSALGLPYITEKQYGDTTVSVSEYTMSEIISSVMDVINESGIKEGILFLDEINCVSETLYPSMLQFLQYKVFGRHKVPEGWVIVTAGNPPEYNRNVREFDVVTLDRLKVIEVEPDFTAWRKYALDKGVHGSILGFLDNNKECFYVMETTASGKSYVTARGWEDLSDIIYLYEEDGKEVTSQLVHQYIKNDRVTADYSAYYDLYNKYKKQMDVTAIFEGKLSSEVKQAMIDSPVDERIALVGMLCDVLRSELKEIYSDYEVVTAAKPLVLKATRGEGNWNCKISLEEQIDSLKQEYDTKKRASSLTANKNRHYKKLINTLNSLYIESDTNEGVKEKFNEYVKALLCKADEAKNRCNNLFEAISDVYSEDGNEMLLLVTELTNDKTCSDFVATFGLDSYIHYSEVLNITDRTKVLQNEIEQFILP